MSRNRVASFLAVLMFIALFAPPIVAQEGGGHWSENEIDPTTWTDGPNLEGSPMDNSTAGNPVVRMSVRYTPNLGGQTVEGEIVLELFPVWVPITATNFIGLAEESFWDGIFFHRVIDDFVAQSGDPRCKTVGTYPATNADCGDGGSGQNIPLEHNDNMSHVDGAIGMARSIEEDSAESQFYICDGPQHGLDPENRDDGGYATFGVVRDGMSHVRAIAEVPTSNDPIGGTIRVPPGPDRPVEEVHIISVEMIGVVMGSDAEEGESGGLSAHAEAVAITAIYPIFWIWALLLIGTIGWTTWRHGFSGQLADEWSFGTGIIDAVLDD